MTTQSLFAPAQHLTDSLAALPWGIHLLVAATLLAGLLLWAAGRQVLKPVVILLACTSASLAGFVLLPVIAPDAGVSPYLGGLGGLILGALAGLLLYRLALATTFGLTLAAAAGLLAATLISLPGIRPAAATDSFPTMAGGGGLGGDEQPVPATGERTKNPYPDVVNPPAPRAAPARQATANQPTAPTPAATASPSIDAPPKQPSTTSSSWSWPTLSLPALSLDSASDLAVRARTFAGALREQASTAWGRFRATDQMIITLAALLGLFGGGIIGLTLPAWSAGVITALAGAAIWLPCAAWLASAAHVPGHERLDLPPTGWAIVWAVVALLGVAVQWTGLMGKAGKPAKQTRAPRAGRAAAA